MNQYHYYHSLRGRQRNEGSAEDMSPERITDNADNNRVAARTEMPEVPESTASADDARNAAS